MDIQQFLRCEEIENYNDDEAKKYYVGPKCYKNGNEIYLDVFKDNGCIQTAPYGTFEQLKFNGISLPYAKSTIIDRDYISCVQGDDGNNNEETTMMHLKLSNFVKRPMR